MPTRQEVAAFRARLLEAVQLLERRLKRRLSGTELAKRWKTSQPTVHRYLEGKGIPPRAMILRIAADCEVDPGWLDYGTRTVTAPQEADEIEARQTVSQSRRKGAAV